MIVYKGRRLNAGNGPQLVLRNGRRLSPKASQMIVNHSPSGFNWGYQGSGPAQLALALLYNVTRSKDIALRFYQDFKRDHVAWWRDYWVITDNAILAWLARQG